MTRTVAWRVVYALALAGALVPIPAALVERWYSRGVYPILQRVLTAVSNMFAVALFDLLWVGATVSIVLVSYRCIRTAGWRRGGFRLAVLMSRAAAVTYLAFLVLWGLNYRRVPLVEKLSFDPGRITRTAVADLGDANATILNRLYQSAHESPPSLGSLSAAFQGAVRQLGAARWVALGQPKQTLLGGYFHQTAVAGMTDPFLLETLLAPDLLDVERPFVIAHEWAHLAGFADESEANFVAWLACRRGDAAAQYSAALALLGYASPRKPVSVALELGPRSDVFAISYRYSRTSRTLRFAARQGYDTFLKANRVERGVDSYDAVVQLILGTELDQAGNPRVR